jgi:hypothetical protein
VKYKTKIRIANFENNFIIRKQQRPDSILHDVASDKTIITLLLIADDRKFFQRNFTLLPSFSSYLGGRGTIDYKHTSL